MKIGKAVVACQQMMWSVGQRAEQQGERKLVGQLVWKLQAAWGWLSHSQQPCQLPL